MLLLTWTDIDYMDQYKVFTLGEAFPLNKMQKLVSDLHANGQHYILMVDPGNDILQQNCYELTRTQPLP
jgi:alpha-glucosidase (family GH31 glycosyl hydrolase)